MFRVSDELWAKIEPLVPAHPNPDRKGRGRKRIADRICFDAILFVFRTGCQWNALSASGIAKSSTVHDRFQEWERAGFFEAMWKHGLTDYDDMHGIDWSFVSMDGAMTKAALGGEENRAQPHRPRQAGHQAQFADRPTRHPPQRRGRGRQPQRSFARA